MRASLERQAAQWPSGACNVRSVPTAAEATSALQLHVGKRRLLLVIRGTATLVPSAIQPIFPLLAHRCWYL